MEREKYKYIMVISINCNKVDFWAILNLEKKMVKGSLHETMEKSMHKFYEGRSVYIFKIRNRDNLDCLK
jgi:NMD protein affecting ribosome stability and mRNA decay